MSVSQKVVRSPDQQNNSSMHQIGTNLVFSHPSILHQNDSNVLHYFHGITVK